MLFNSPIFLFLFLPLALGGFYLSARLGGRTAAIWFLLAASCAFYAYSSLFNFGLFIATVFANFMFGAMIARARGSKRVWLIGGIALNLCLIGTFKYLGLFVSTANDLFSLSLAVPHLLLPVGISFYTFEQISYLLETREHGRAEPSFARYALFAGFFPHLIAGPIIRPHLLLPQFTSPGFGRFEWPNFAVGVTFLLLGLFKKVILADGSAAFATPIFTMAQAGGGPGLFEAWGAAIAYTFQIYFDFSGYSDMAIGLGLMFGIRLPFNFNSPYRATGIIDFWRRWHMTLSLFLRDYVYIPLGGNRGGSLRRYTNIMLTMLIGGLWHGANWTFVAWGGLHGAFLLINHVWRELRGKRKATAIGQWAGRCLTLFVVLLAWVFFRADGFAAARRMFAGMSGRNGWMSFASTDAGAWFSRLVQLGGIPLPPGRIAAGILQIVWCTGLLFVVWSLPNTQQFLLGEGRPENAKLRWKPSPAWAAALGIGIGAAFTYTIVAVNRVSEFIYFIF